MSEQLDRFLKSYWDYYLDLEEQLLETRRFVAFDKKNKSSFSVEYLKLYQAVCSEIDVVGKEMAVSVNTKFKPEKSNIQKWGYEIQQKYPHLKDDLVKFNDSEIIQPFKDWEYEVSISKSGAHNLRIRDGKNPIKWWRDYNKVKHNRTGLVEGTNNFELANQQNLIAAFSALFLLETIHIQSIDSDAKYQKSKLFKREEGTT